MHNCFHLGYSVFVTTYPEVETHVKWSNITR